MTYNKNLQAEDKSGREEIVAIVNQQLKEKLKVYEQQIEQRGIDLASNKKIESAKLRQAFTEKTRSTQGKINDGIAVLQKRQADENQKYVQQHQQQIRQQQLTAQVAREQWQRILPKLNAKYNSLMDDYRRKGKEFFKKIQLQFDREQENLNSMNEKRFHDLKAQRQIMISRLQHNYTQNRNRYLRRHLQSIAKRRHVLETELVSIQDQQLIEPTDKEPPKEEHIYDLLKIKPNENIALKPVIPIQTAVDWRKESTYEPSGAADRHKHRKLAMNQIDRKLSVEIHNEGIWLSEISDNKTDLKKKKDSSNNAATQDRDKKYFFPWGVKARKILESIVCGEVPHACDSMKLSLSDAVAQNGGHIRCLMTDLRTSDATASSQRAEAIMKKEVDELKKLEHKDAAHKSSMAETSRLVDGIKKQRHELTLKCKETSNDLEKNKRHVQGFRNKYSRYYGSGTYAFDFASAVRVAKTNITRFLTILFSRRKATAHE